MIATPGSPDVTRAAKAATTTLPIVFAVGEDPVKLGLVTTLARPGTNMTGVNFFASELSAKRLGLLRELVPGAARVAVLVNPTNATGTEATLRDVQAAARAMGLQIQVLNASTSARLMQLRIPRARASRSPLRRRRRVFQQPTPPIALLAVRYAVPATYSVREYCEAGGLMSYGTNFTDAFRQAGDLLRPHPQGRQARRPAGTCSRRNSSWSSTCRPPRCSASTCRRRCSPAPTR